MDFNESCDKWSTDRPFFGPRPVRTWKAPIPTIVSHVTHRWQVTCVTYVTLESVFRTGCLYKTVSMFQKCTFKYFIGYLLNVINQNLISSKTRLLDPFPVLFRSPRTDRQEIGLPLNPKKESWQWKKKTKSWFYCAITSLVSSAFFLYFIISISHCI